MIRSVSPLALIVSFLFAAFIGPHQVSAKQQGSDDPTAKAENRIEDKSGSDNVQGVDDAERVIEPAKREGVRSQAELLETSIRRIYFYESQAPKLVPPSFWQVSIKELEEALSRREDTPQRIENRPYLASTVYVAQYQRGSLISDASTFDIIYRDKQPTSLELGRMNLALESQAATGTGARGSPADPSNRSGRLVTDGNGVVRAMVDQDCRLRFGWSRRGVPTPGGRLEFDLQIPPCGRTRMVIGMPEGIALQTQDGVLTALPSPPPEARRIQGETALAWYAIEAGGLNRVRLTVQDRVDTRAVEQKYTMRKLGMDCSVDRRGINWTARLVVDIPRGSSLPSLLVNNGGRITEVRVHGSPVRWQETTTENGTELAFMSDSSESVAAITSNRSGASLASSIEIYGTVSVDSQNPHADQAQGASQVRGASQSHSDGKVNELRLPIPWLRLAQSRATLAFAESEVLLRVGAGVQLAELRNAGNWRSELTGGELDLSTTTAEISTRTYQLSGPPAEKPPIVRCLLTRVLGLSIAAFRLTVVDDGLRANWEAAIESRDEGPQPLTFEVQTGWQVESVSIRSSGRVIDLRDEESGQFTLWPERGDIADGVLRIQITGSRGLAESDDTKVVPRSWFVRQANAMLQCYAAVVPPTEYEWVAGTAMVGGIVDAGDLPKLASEMIGPIMGETLLFATDNGETPELELAQPPAAFNCDVQFDVSLDGQELVERLRIDFRVPAGRVPNVQVHLGVPASRPPMRWIVLAKPPTGMRFPTGGLNANATGEALAAKMLGGNMNSVLDTETADPETRDNAATDNEIWELEPSEGIRDGLTLYGERRYPVNPARYNSLDKTDDEVVATEKTESAEVKWRLPLPSLPLTPAPQGSTQRATVSIGSRIGLLDTTGEVLRIPRINAEQETKVANDSQVVWMLRYDPTEDATILINPHPDRDTLPIIWEQRVDILAGTAGDEIAAAFRSEGGGQFIIEYDPAMLVTRVEGVQFETGQREPGKIHLAATPETKQFQVFFWRPVSVKGPLRLARSPDIRIAGIVMRRHVRLWPAADTLALVPGQVAIAPTWMEKEARGTTTQLIATQPIWLIPSGLAWAMGGGIAVFFFAIGWMLIGRLPWLAVSIILAVSVLAFVVPVWSSSILGFVVVPLAAAGLLTSSLEMQRRRALETVKPSAGGVPFPGSSFVDPLAPTATHKQRFADGSHIDSALHDPTGGKADADQKFPGPKTSGSGSIKSWIGFFLILVIVATTQATDSWWVSVGAQETPETGTAPAPVMIPVREDGQIVGDRVYVPKSLFDLLFRPKTIEEQLGRIDFQSADYDVRVSSSGMRGVADTVSIDAVWRVEIESASQLVRLPIDPATLDRFEVIVDSVPNEIRPEPDGLSILVRPPKAGINIIRASFTPQVETTVAGTGRIALTIPAVANSSITITPDTPLEQISLPGCLGQINKFDSGTRLTASLGPVEELELIWQRRGSLSIDTTSSLRRRWWVHAGLTSISRELELEVGSGVRGGVIVDLIAEGLASPQITTPDWTFAPNETPDAVRNRLRFISTTDSPGPIRLMWTDAVSSQTDLALLLPNVRPTTQSGGIETAIAIDLPEGWRVIAIDSAANPAARSSNSTGTSTSIFESELMEEDADSTSDSSRDANPSSLINAAGQGDAIFRIIEPNEFATAWRGFRGDIDFARKHPNPGAISIRVDAPLAGTWTADLTHDVVVTSGHLEVDFIASITPAPNSSRPISILLPQDFRVAKFAINGRVLERVFASSIVESRTDDRATNSSGPTGSQNTDEILLPTLPPNLMTEVRVSGTIALAEDRRFSIPRIRIGGVQVLDDRYVMSRTDGLRIRELREPEAAIPASFAAEYDLMAGTVPLRYWQFVDHESISGGGVSLNSTSGTTSGTNTLNRSKVIASKETWDGGRFRVNIVNDRFAANALTSLRWNDGVWTMEYVVEVENYAGLTDFLTFKIPSRWIEGLDVQPAVKWSSQPSTDSESHLIRVLPMSSTIDRMVTNSDAGEATTRKLVLKMTSRLENAGDGGVSVPQVLLLGGGRRTNYFTVPNKLTTSPIIWQVQNARPEETPQAFAAHVSAGESHTLYEAIGDTFSATLQPAPVGVDSAQIPMVDLALFPGGQASPTVTGLMRVFVLPGDREFLEFQIPKGTNVLGAWAAGISVGVQQVGPLNASQVNPKSESTANLATSIVRIPLALSRLADQVVLLFEFTPATVEQASMVPSVIDLPVSVTWVARFDRSMETAENAGQAGIYSKLFQNSQNWMNSRFSQLAQTSATEPSSPEAARYRTELVQMMTDLLSSSIDSAAERPAVEKREWLKPWFVRLRSWGWVPEFETGTTEAEPRSLASVSPNANLLPQQSQDLLDEWAPKFFQRVFGSDLKDQGLGEQATEGSWMTTPAGWTATELKRYANPDGRPVTELPPVVMPVEQFNLTSNTSVRWGMIAGAVMLFCSAVLLLLVGTKFLASPAFWLFLLGTASIGLAPFPISIAAILLSLVAPLLRKR